MIMDYYDVLVLFTLLSMCGMIGDFASILFQEPSFYFLYQYLEDETQS